VSFKHCTLALNVKAADLTDISVEQPIAEVRCGMYCSTDLIKVFSGDAAALFFAVGHDRWAA
jgi:hypothetical protein